MTALSKIQTLIFTKLFGHYFLLTIVSIKLNYSNEWRIWVIFFIRLWISIILRMFIRIRILPHLFYFVSLLFWFSTAAYFLNHIGPYNILAISGNEKMINELRKWETSFEDHMLSGQDISKPKYHNLKLLRVFLTPCICKSSH